jgi:hypothetical protein
MRRARSNYGRTSGTYESSFICDCDLQLTIDDVPDFVIRMTMLMNAGACRNRVIRKRHVPQMEEARAWILTPDKRLRFVLMNLKRVLRSCTAI